MPQARSRDGARSLGGSGRPRTSPEWRPFNGNLSDRSVAHALSILGALLHRPIEQRYVLADPFAGVKVLPPFGPVLAQ
jgi:hypothetical protein